MRESRSHYSSVDNISARKLTPTDEMVGVQRFGGGERSDQKSMEVPTFAEHPSVRAQTEVAQLNREEHSTAQLKSYQHCNALTHRCLFRTFIS